MGEIPYERLKINLRLKLGRSSCLPWFYSYNLYHALLSVINHVNPSLSKRIREDTAYKRSFVFSLLIPSHRDKARIQRNASFEGMPAPFQTHFYLTSRSNEILSTLVKGLSQTSLLFLTNDKGEKVFYSIEIIQRQRFSLSLDHSYSFLSPLHLRRKDGSPLFSGKRVIHLEEKSMIEDELKKSFLRVSSAIDLSFEPDITLEGENVLFKTKRYTLSKHSDEKNSLVALIPVSGKTRIRFGNAETLLSALYLGLGDKTHLGFGMVGL